MNAKNRNIPAGEWFSLAGLCLLAALLVHTLPAQATDDHTEFFVNSTADINDYGNNSICEVLPIGSNVCTLRAALTEANYCDTDPNVCGDYVLIHLPAGTYTLTIPGADEDNNASGDLDFRLSSTPIILEGAGAGVTIIDADGLDRVLQTFNAYGGNVTLRDMTLRGGHLAQSPAQTYQEGGGIKHFGGILELDHVIVEDNTIYCPPELSSFDCSHGIGGGIFAGSQLRLLNSSVRNNSANRGAGLFYNGDSETFIYHSTFSGNQGVSGAAVTAYGPISAINSTFSNNRASGTCGGIVNADNMKLANVTIASNRSSGGNMANLSNSGASSTLHIKNSIIANPQGGFSGSNCYNSGTWDSNGYNIYSDASCPAGGTGDLASTDPKLTPLAWLGGPTQTHGLLFSSPAVNRLHTLCLDFSGFTNTLDQRGVFRDAHCDIGAFEGMAYAFFLPFLGR